MKQEDLQEVLDRYFLLAGYSDLEREAFTSDLEDTLTRITLPPEILFVVYEDGQDEGQGFFSLEGAQDEIRQLHAKGSKGDIVLSLDINEKEPDIEETDNLCLAFEPIYSDTYRINEDSIS